MTGKAATVFIQAVRMKSLREAFTSRYQRMVDTSHKWNKPLPDRVALWDKLLNSYNNGFKCIYCGTLLEISQPSPSLNVFSFDHLLPFAHGGSNDISNIGICCHECNIIKGTITAPTFRRLLLYLESDPTLKSHIFKEIWIGRIADKIDRMNNLHPLLQNTKVI